MLILLTITTVSAYYYQQQVSVLSLTNLLSQSPEFCKNKPNKFSLKSAHIRTFLTLKCSKCYTQTVMKCMLIKSFTQTM